MASKKTLPIPGTEKMTSMINAPPISPASHTPDRVTIGISA